MGVAHGASTTGTATTSAGESSAQYTAKHAWAQPVQGGVSTALAIPSGDRLTITAVQGNGDVCSFTANLNGSSITYDAFTMVDGRALMRVEHLRPSSRSRPTQAPSCAVLRQLRLSSAI